MSAAPSFDAYLRTMEALSCATGAGMARPLAFAEALHALEAGAAAYPDDLRNLIARVAGDCRAEPLKAASLLRRAGVRIKSIGVASGERSGEPTRHAAAADALIDCANAIAGSAP